MLNPEADMSRIAAGMRAAPSDDQARTHQIGGTHYRDMHVQPWDAIDVWLTHEQAVGFYLGTAMAYLARFNADGVGKGGLVDVEKAHHTLGKLIETLKEEER